MELGVRARMAVNELLNRFSFCLSDRMRLCEAYISNFLELCGYYNNHDINIRHE